jgi:hypothetical protein
MPSKAEVLERERRWALPAGLITIGAVLLFVGSSILVGSAVSADEEAELLREVDANSGTYLVAGILRAVASLALVAPLLYLFRAAEGRSPRVRGQLIGVIYAAPIFMAAGALVSSLASIDAASELVAQGITGSGEKANDAATDLIQEASLRPLASGLSLAGALGFAFVMVYTCLWGMRTGLLSRFWGSLGMALGAVSFFLVQFLPFVLLWFIYLGLVVTGWVPRGRPPAWDAGEAIPWPSPGEEQAERVREDDDPGAVEGEGRELDEAPAPAADPANSPRSRGERRKRKRRSS